MVSEAHLNATSLVSFTPLLSSSPLSSHIFFYLISLSDLLFPPLRCPLGTTGVGGGLALVAIQEGGRDDQHCTHEEHTGEDTRQDTALHVSETNDIQLGN